MCRSLVAVSLHELRLAVIWAQPREVDDALDEWLAADAPTSFQDHHLPWQGMRKVSQVSSAIGLAFPADEVRIDVVSV